MSQLYAFLRTLNFYPKREIPVEFELLPNRGKVLAATVLSVTVFFTVIYFQKKLKKKKSQFHLRMLLIKQQTFIALNVWLKFMLYSALFRAMTGAHIKHSFCKLKHDGCLRENLSVTMWTVRRTTSFCHSTFTWKNDWHDLRFFRLGHLAETFSKINKVSLSLQGKQYSLLQIIKSELPREN